MAEPPSSPPSDNTSAEDALAWYKSQYEQLEHELSEFQASSKELEAELEKDLDAADKRERGLREKAEELNFEVEEWKVCLSPNILSPLHAGLSTWTIFDEAVRELTHGPLCRGNVGSPKRRQTQRKTHSKRR